MQVTPSPSSLAGLINWYLTKLESKTAIPNLFLTFLLYLSHSTTSIQPSPNRSFMKYFFLSFNNLSLLNEEQGKK